MSESFQHFFNSVVRGSRPVNRSLSIFGTSKLARVPLLECPIIAVGFVCEDIGKTFDPENLLG